MKAFFMFTGLLAFAGAFAILAYATKVQFPPLGLVAMLYAIYGACAVVGYGREVRADYRNACARSNARVTF